MNNRLSWKWYLLIALISTPIWYVGLQWYRDYRMKQEILSTDEWNLPDQETPQVKESESQQAKAPEVQNRTTNSGDLQSTGGASSKRSAPPASSDRPTAPSLEVAEWVNSDPITLKELRGQVVVLEFIQII